MQKKHHQTNPYGKDMRHENWRISVTGKAKLTSVLLMMLLLTVSVSCCKQREKPSVSGNKADTIATEKKDLLQLYDKQIRAYYEELSDVGMDGIEVMPCKSQVEYTDIAIELIYEALKRTGFRTVDNETARKAILKYYGVDISQNNTTLAEQGFLTYIFKNGNPTERKRQNIAMNSAFYEKPSYFWNKIIYVPNYNYIFPHPTINEVVDIKGLPDIFEEDYDVRLFKTGKLYYDLSRKEPYYENEFIFHDSKKAFAWLKKNEWGFLTNLLQKYGYDKNEEINRLLLEWMVMEYATVAKSHILDETFAIKKKTKWPHVEIREGLLKSVLKLPVKVENIKISSLMNTYIKYMLHEDEEDIPDWATEFNKEERYKVAAYLCYYQYRFCKKFGVEETELLGQALYNDTAFRDYIADENYFNLQGFQELCNKVYEEVDISEKLKKAYHE